MTLDAGTFLAAAPGHGSGLVTGMSGSSECVPDKGSGSSSDFGFVGIRDDRFFGIGQRLIWHGALSKFCLCFNFCISSFL